MAIVTSTQSGDWSTGATWVGGVAPGSADDAIIVSGHVIVVDSSITIGTIDLEGILTLGPSSELTLDGDLTFDGGSPSLLTTATSGGWAKVNGVGGIVPADSTTNLTVDLEYVSFQNTGNIHFKMWNGGGVAISHCTFTNSAEIDFGTGGWTDGDIDITLDNCDFIDVGEIVFTGFALTTGDSWARGCTFKSTGAYEVIRLFTRGMHEFSGCIFNNYTFSLGHTMGGVTFDNNFCTVPDTHPDASNFIVADAGSPPWDVTDSYHYANSSNVHWVAMTSSGGVSDISGNIFEGYGTEPNWLPASSGTTFSYTNNILIGTGAFVSNVGDRTGIGVTISRNTIFNTTDTIHQGLWLSENGNYSGPISIKNNIVVGNLGALNGVVTDNGTPFEEITYAGWNNYYGTSDNYKDVTIGTQSAPDIDVDPGFVDDTRNLAAWSLSIGESETVAAAKVQMDLLNGYNSTTMTQSDTPSGYQASDVLAYVSAGFVPTNSALSGTGEGGVDIGAMDVQIIIEEISGKIIDKVSDKINDKIR